MTHLVTQQGYCDVFKTSSVKSFPSVRIHFFNYVNKCFLWLVVCHRLFVRYMCKRYGLLAQILPNKIHSQYCFSLHLIQHGMFTPCSLSTDVNRKFRYYLTITTRCDSRLWFLFKWTKWIWDGGIFDLGPNLNMWTFVGDKVKQLCRENIKVLQIITNWNNWLIFNFTLHYP